jgi:glyoxylase-like metal-dependent hydrolase (beta-lactamase superfamily II)
MARFRLDRNRSERDKDLMNEALSFDRSDVGPHGLAVAVSPLVRRLVAPNGGPFTFTGTCSYLVGQTDVVIIDPGPENDAHFAALVAAIGDAAVSAIVVTHTHKDHSPLARRLKALTGASIIGCAPHHAARALGEGEVNLLDASSDLAYQPDRVMGAGDRFEGRDFRLEAVPTPGHTMNHLAFALLEEKALFSGDHVMAWSTSIVAPPDGAMGAYMASLEVLMGRDEAIYWPGHGGPVTEPARFVRGLLHHRRMRETTIAERVAAGDRTIPAIVERLYSGLDPKLKGAAALSVFAHLEELVAQGRVQTESEARLEGEYWVE